LFIPFAAYTLRQKDKTNDWQKEGKEMNTTLPVTCCPPVYTEGRTTTLQSLKSFLHSVLSLFAAQDDPAALRYMLTKNGETVD
jgi:hypothetical protein